ncbi:MAG TPA: hypothetical protein DHM37_09465 [Candidatus Cloacimonas sp.]|jgi:energy-coupling factor transporter ATP-binding protein EcfA2|nr:cobalt/nickel transport system ATP-binding protein [Candidatus Cloacimonadota bacterium]HCX73933.1 hypothetical protein [Candidatus Cloacimonas sp.]
MIEFKNFSFSFPEQEIFRGVNLRFPLKKPVLIQGDNGSGKTTLARIISGLIPDYSGEILLKKKKLADFTETEFADKIIYIKQEAEQNFVAATLEEDLQIWQHGFSQIEKVGEERSRKKTFSKLKLTEISQRLIWQLSGGQRKRGSLAPLLLPNNKIWLLDEPAAGLDALSVKILLQLLKEKRAIIFSNRKSIYESLNPLEMEIVEKKIIRIN